MSAAETTSRRYPGETDDNNLRRLADRCIEQGYEPFPLPHARKSPPPDGVTGWRGQAATPAAWDRWEAAGRLRGANLGLRVPEGVIGIDVDHYGDKTGGDTLAAVETKLGVRLPPTHSITSRPRTPSRISLYRVPVGTVLKTEIDLDGLSNIEII